MYQMVSGAVTFKTYYKGGCKMAGSLLLSYIPSAQNTAWDTVLNKYTLNHIE